MADAKHRSDIASLRGSDRMRARILRPVGQGAALWPRLPALALMQLLRFFRSTLAPHMRIRARQRPMWYVAARGAPVAYLNVTKAASSALSAAVQDETDRFRTVRQRRLRPDQRSHFKFAFVRDPFARLASCYMHLVKSTHHLSVLNRYLWGALRLDLGFDVFARTVCQIPDALADRHFLSQSRQLFPGGEPLVDFVGRFERLEEQFEPLRRRYGLAALRRMNASPGYDYRKLYTEELVELVARRYAEDIERFGYQDARRELLRHASERRAERA